MENERLLNKIKDKDIYISDGLFGFFLCITSLLDGILHLPLQLADICIQLSLRVEQTGVLQPNDNKPAVNKSELVLTIHA